VGGQRARILLRLRQLRAGLRRHREQIRIDADEIGQSALRGGQRPEPGRHRRLPLVLVIFAESVLVPFPPSVGRQPCQIQRPKVTGGELGADADDSRKRILGALPHSPESSSLIKSRITDSGVAVTPTWPSTPYCSAIFGLSRVRGSRSMIW